MLRFAKHDLKLLSTYLKPHRFVVMGLGLLLFVSITLQVINPQIVRYFIDTAISNDTSKSLTAIALVFIVLAFLQQVISVFSTYIGEKVGWSATNQLRSDLAEHCLKLDMAFHNKTTPGTLIERLDGDITVLANFFSQLFLRIIGNILLLIGVLIAIFYEDWRAGLGLTLFVILGQVVLIFIRKIPVPHHVRARESSADLSGFLEERLSGTEDIQANGGSAYTMNQLYGLMKNRLVKERKAGVMGSTVWVVSRGFFILANVLAFTLGYYLFRAGAITLGTTYLLFRYADILYQPIDQIILQIGDLQKAGASIQRINELFAKTSTIQDGHTAQIPPGPLAVEFDEVSFTYDPGRPTLADISFRLEAGKTLGLLGRTGSGKTTLTRLLFRLYDPTTGSIRLGEQPIQGATVSELRDRISMVTQDVQLFQASLRDNLTFFDTTISDQQILSVLKDLGLWSWFETLPKQLDTELDAGSSLSAGEAQLLAFARVFLKNPGLVILDEASSRLDPATEQLIERAISKLFQQRTGIVIAHRLSTLQRVDQVMIIEDGRICEFGSYRELADNPFSRFYQLLQSERTEELA